MRTALRALLFMPYIMLESLFLFLPGLSSIDRRADDWRLMMTRDFAGHLRLAKIPNFKREC